MSETTANYGDVTTQIVREDPEIEAIKLGLLQDAAALANQPVGLPVLDEAGNQVFDADGNPVVQLPQSQIAGMSQLQTDAIADVVAATGADGQGIGGFQQYLTDAGMTLDQAQNLLLGTTNEAGEVDPGAFQQAINAYTTGMGGVTKELRDDYFNPYQEAVQAEIDRQYDLQQAAKGLEAAGSGAFGGSRFAVAQAEIDRNRAQQTALAKAQAFEFAQGAAERELNRQLQAAQGIGNLGIAGTQALGTLGLQKAGLGELSQKQSLLDIQTQFELGKQQQLQDQAVLEAQKQNQLAALYEPFNRISFLSDIYRGAPSTQQTIAASSSPAVSPAQTFLGLGVAGLSAAAGAKESGLF